MSFGPGWPPVMVQWYFTDAPFLPYYTLYASNNNADRDDATWPGPGEIYRAPRPWRNGHQVGDAPGVRPCGSAEQWASPLAWPSPDVPTDDTGTPLCCFTGPHSFDQLPLMLAFKASFRGGAPGPPWWMPLGLSFRAVMAHSRGVVSQTPLALTFAADFVHTPPLAEEISLWLGFTASFAHAQHASSTMPVKLGFGAAFELLGGVLTTACPNKISQALTLLIFGTSGGCHNWTPPPILLLYEGSGPPWVWSGTYTGADGSPQAISFTIAAGGTISISNSGSCVFTLTSAHLVCSPFAWSASVTIAGCCSGLGQFRVNEGPPPPP